MNDALETIAAKCPSLAARALQALKTRNARRASLVIEAALSEPCEGLTKADRKALSSALVAIVDDSGRRDVMRHFRLSATEDAALAEEAESLGVSVSELIRSKVIQ